MIVAVFSDVHANLVALEVMLDRVRGTVDGYVCLGDVVDYGPWNDECLEVVAGLPNVTVIQGNHEVLFLDPSEVEHEIDLVRQFFHASRESFSREDLIADLPQTAQLGSFMCVHTIDGRRIFADTDVVVERDSLIGHSHYQYQMERNGKLVVNPGSVGQNRHRIDHVEYALYDTDRALFTFESVPYDIRPFVAELEARHYPSACIAYYERKLSEARAR